MGQFKAFVYGQASGVVEPVAGVLGAWLVISMGPLLPYALTFAAGAMIFVVVEELIPESQRHSSTDFATIGDMLENSTRSSGSAIWNVRVRASRW